MIIRIVQNIQRINKEGNAPLYISFYLGKEKVVIPCKLSVPTTKFDSKTGMLRGTNRNHKKTVYWLSFFILPCLIISILR